MPTSPRPATSDRLDAVATTGDLVPRRVFANYVKFCISPTRIAIEKPLNEVDSHNAIGSSYLLW